METRVGAFVSQMITWLEGTKNCREVMEAYLGKIETRIETGQEPREAESKTVLEKVKATELETVPEEIEVVVAHQEIPNEEAPLETIRVLKDQCGDQRLAKGYWNAKKWRMKNDVVHGTHKRWTFERSCQAKPK
jgi:hypothetical protein